MNDMDNTQIPTGDGMKHKPLNFERVYDPDGDKTDPRKIAINEEIRKRAIADAERAFQNVREDLRRLIRSCRGETEE